MFIYAIFTYRFRQLNEETGIKYDLVKKIPKLGPEVEEFRKSKLGQFCKMMYDEHRNQTI
jgi:hypothetical protein